MPIVTLDDIFVVILMKNLKDGATRASYSVLCNFFDDLRRDPKDWASDQVKAVLDRVFPDDVDHMMTRVFGLSDGCSFKGEVGDDSCYMNEQQASRAKEYYDSLAQEDKDSLDEIARRYGELLGRWK